MLDDMGMSMLDFLGSIPKMTRQHFGTPANIKPRVRLVHQHDWHDNKEENFSVYHERSQSSFLFSFFLLHNDIYYSTGPRTKNSLPKMHISSRHANSCCEGYESQIINIFIKKKNSLPTWSSRRISSIYNYVSIQCHELGGINWQTSYFTELF